MKLFSNSKLAALTVSLLGIVWCLGIFTAVNLFDISFAGAGGITASLLAVLLADVYLLVFRTSSGKQAVEVGFIGVYYTVIYLIIVLLANTIFIFLRYGDFNMALLTVNLLLDVGYIILVISIEKNTARLRWQLDRTEQVCSNTTELSHKLGQLLSMAEDKNIQKQLLKLKEAVDYSNNVTTVATYTAEKDMSVQLDGIMIQLLNHADTNQILSEIATSEATWKARSNSASSMR